MRVLDLGRLDYSKALQLQYDLVARRKVGEVADTLVLVEHDDVVTLGRKTPPESVKSLPLPVFQVDRGGEATYHGPGQLVGYPIFSLPDHDVRAFVRLLEGVLIASAGRFLVAAARREGHPGVWVGDRKLASIGLAVSDWVTYHGFALNVSTDLARFELIRPCGLDPKTMTSMAQVLGREVDFDSVKAAVAEEFLDAVGRRPSPMEPVREPTSIK